MLPISKIINKINQKKEEGTFSKEELFLSLVISENSVKSGIWVFEEGFGVVLSFGSVESWDGKTPEELIVAADASIAAAVTLLPELSDKQPSRVVLGLPEDWLEEGSIKSGKVKLLQNICKKLLLTPLGYVVTSEALAHQLKKEEGGQTSAIFVTLEETEISVAVIVRGKYLGCKVVGRSSNLALDIEEGLLRFDLSEDLPQRIILIDGKELQEARDILVSYPWVGPGERKLKFLQLPKVDLAQKNYEVTSVVLAGSKEIGPKKVETKIETQIEEEVPLKEEFTKEENLEEKNIEIEEIQNFGFIEDQDIVKTSGFVDREEEIEPKEDLPTPGKDKNELEVLPNQRPFLSEEIKETVFPSTAFKTPKFSLYFLINFLKKIGHFFSGFRLNFGKGLIFLFLGIFVVLLGFAFTYYKIVKADVSLMVKPQNIVKEFDFTVSSKVNSVDVDKMILPTEEVAVDSSNSRSVDVKGKKTVGDKASGEITIYNGTDKTKTYPKGTAIKGGGNLRFLFKEEVIVPAKTTDLTATPPIDRWGEKKITVEASDIGAQYNIASGSTLSFDSGNASSSSMLVKNINGFSGGSSREILAVSKEDRDTLERTLISELTASTKDDLQKKVEKLGHLLPDSFQLKNKSSNFNHDVGDEASILTLDEKITLSSLYFKDENLNILVDKLVSSSLSSDFENTPVNNSVNFTLKDKDKGIYHAKVTRDYLPKIDTSTISTNLKAKPFFMAKTFLEGFKTAAGYEISITPKIFSKLKFFPLREQNIRVTVKPV